MSADPLFKVVFMNQGQVYEVYARQIDPAAMFGFIAVEELVFGERSTVVVDPTEEKLKTEFANVKRTYIPMHSIIRIDEVEKRGQNKILEIDGSLSNITPFPLPPSGSSGS